MIEELKKAAEQLTEVLPLGDRYFIKAYKAEIQTLLTYVTQAIESAGKWPEKKIKVFKYSKIRNWREQSRGRLRSYGYRHVLGGEEEISEQEYLDNYQQGNRDSNDAFMGTLCKGEYWKYSKNIQGKESEEEINAFNAALDACLSVHVAEIAEKDKEIAFWKEWLDIILDKKENKKLSGMVRKPTVEELLDIIHKEVDRFREHSHRADASIAAAIVAGLEAEN